MTITDYKLPFYAMTDHFYLRYDDTTSLARKGFSAKSLATLQGIRSPKTLAAYEADWNDFCCWCHFHGVAPFPADPVTVANYINDMADYAKVSTIKRRVSAISANYRAAAVQGMQVSNPCDDAIIERSLQGLSQMKGDRPDSQAVLSWEEVEAMVRCIDLTTVSGLRNRAILLLGFMSTFRRSELTALCIEDIHRHPLGIVIGAPFLNGRYIGIPDLTGILDPTMDCVTAMRDWVRQTGLRKGPLFRRLSKNGNVADYKLSDKSINFIIKQYASAIGLNPKDYGSQSLRTGVKRFISQYGLNTYEMRKFMNRKPRGRYRF